MDEKIKIPCTDCLVLGICKAIVVDKINQLNVFDNVLREVDGFYKLPKSIQYKSFLTQSSINNVINLLLDRCSLLDSYVNDPDDPDEPYWNVRNFFNLNQEEWWGEK